MGGACKRPFMIHWTYVDCSLLITLQPIQQTAYWGGAKEKGGGERERERGGAVLPCKSAVKLLGIAG